MIWSKGLTAEQASLYVLGFNHRLPIHQIYSDKEIEVRSLLLPDDEHELEVEKAFDELDKINQIYSGLLHEVQRLDEGFPSVLVFYLRKTPLERSLITIDSLADWFCQMGDIEKAKTMLPSFIDSTNSIESAKKELAEVKAQLVQSENMFEEFKKHINSMIDDNHGEFRALNSELFQKLTDAEIETISYKDELEDAVSYINELKQKYKNIFEENENLKQALENHRPISFVDATNYPSGINNAIQLFNECWSHLSDDMKRPAKDNLEAFIKIKLRMTEKTTIKALIKLSTPDNDRYHGKPKTGRTQPWKPKSFN
jgi:DNA repair exonuclease SbcCD ATPase subunit